MAGRGAKYSEVVPAAFLSVQREGGSARYRVWMAVGAVLVVAGILVTVFAAVAVARNDADKSRQAFRSSSAEVASTLQLAIQHEEDLIANVSGHVAETPSAPNSQFVRWASSVRALERYPELASMGLGVIVPAQELPAFARRAVIDPAGALSADGGFDVLPPGKRSFYCLTLVSISRGPAYPVGFDYCATEPIRSAALSSRDSGLSAYLPVQLGGTALMLSIQTPVYRGGVVPPTVVRRREAFLGWVGMAFVPNLVLDRALQGHPDTAVAFRYRQGSSNVVFRWEYKPGSTLFAIWNSGRQGFLPREGNESFRGDVNNLFDLHPANTFLIKVSYWLNR